LISRLRLQVVVAVVGFFAVTVSLAYFLIVVERRVEPVEGGTYVEGVVLSDAPNLTLIPVGEVNSLSQDVSSLVFSGLTRIAYDESFKANIVTADLAERWEPSGDFKTWTFYLRKNARWHDGAPVTSRDVVFTANLIKNPDFRAPALLQNLFKDWQIERLGDYAVRFRLKDPWTPFINYTNFGLLPAHILGDTTAKDILGSNFNLKPIGTGPYRILPEGLTNEGVTLVRNPVYYGAKPYIEKIWFRYYPSSKSAIDALKNNQINGISAVPPAERKALAEDPNIVEISAPRTVNNFLFLNLSRANLFGQKQVRQAMAYALNKRDLIGEVLEGQANISNSPILPFSWAYKSNLKTYDYNPATARQLLEEAGWKPNIDGVRQKETQTLTFDLLVLGEQEEVARKLAAYLKEVGIVAEVRRSPGPLAFLTDLNNRNYDAVLIGVQGVTNDPDVYQNWHSTQADNNGLNYSGWKNDRTDQILERARQIINEGERKILYNQWQDVWSEEIPSIPLYYQTYTFAINNTVGGIRPEQIQVANQPSDRFKDITSRYVQTATRFGNRQIPTDGNN
jgi:peptide/nickel transport system substrate-binding protein